MVRQTRHEQSAFPRFWQRGSHRLPLFGHPLIMGILNVTPDSFSDGGQFTQTRCAINHALRMEQEGADIIDIGGESTRPFAAPVSAEEECRRVLPVIKALAKRVAVPISIDTTKADVARKALDMGAAIVNDISGLTRDPAMLAVIAGSKAGVVIMHCRGNPQTMQKAPRYKNLIGDIVDFLERQLRQAQDYGIAKARITIDPGIGFGKTARHNLTLIHHLAAFSHLGVPVLIGPSRKSFIQKALDASPIPMEKKTAVKVAADPRSRIEGTAAAVAIAVTHGARVIRVHDVAFMSKVARLADAIRKSG